MDAWVKALGTDRELIKKWKEGRISWEKFASEFASEYRKSLKGKEGLLRGLAAESEKGTITLLCTDRDKSMPQTAPKGCDRGITGLRGARSRQVWAYVIGERGRATERVKAPLRAPN